MRNFNLYKPPPIDDSFNTTLVLLHSPWMSSTHMPTSSRYVVRWGRHWHLHGFLLWVAPRSEDGRCNWNLRITFNYCPHMRTHIPGSLLAATGNVAALYRPAVPLDRPTQTSVVQVLWSARETKHEWWAISLGLLMVLLLIFLLLLLQQLRLLRWLVAVSY